MTNETSSPADRAAQHRAVLAVEAEALLADRRPEPGPIAVLPNAEDRFVEAVEAAGGTVEPLSDRTRGVVWLSYREAKDFPEILREHPGIGWVQLPYAGVDAFSEILAEEDRPGLVWTSAKGAYAQPVAEHALALTLALLRVLPKRVRARSWATEQEGRSLYGLDVVIVGAGGIALELMRLLEPFGARVTIVRRSADPVPGAERTVTADRLEEVLPTADVVVIAAALTGGTRHLFDARRLAAMKPTAYLVNIARGGLVDSDALLEALRAGTIAGAALDVTDPEPLPDGHPLWDEPNCLITPHQADTPEMTAPLLAERIRLNVHAFLDDGRFVGIVDPSAGY
ncbi:D-isomer specific 2-hydroxyacid dehydrogenase family protein [Leifsonia sp. F6_8S_P_1B]|uniref:D-isomer specific 2-hydroxyacid dehydrogenase family protein n=1 Tax=Leifsonia williamsii TaxID=3035919 RepID=A0ABT8KCS2_9MICO|nr:D-isomer specific 2-hydroxyacid dehydrogenase family protein [Leifsonia williamsii]MDN4615265.1 D-isomer specific 2-hydroxyacid dehydrogenase family protein [Leifsonia williamsii]